MKHIVVVGKYYPPEFGGVERYSYDVARVAAEGHRVTVLVHDKGPDDRIGNAGNVTVIRCGTKKIIKAQPISPSMFKHFRSLKADLVQFSAPNFWAAAVLLANGYDGPLVVTHHADVFGRPFLKSAVMPLYHRLVRRAQCVVVNSLKNASASNDLPAKAGPLIEIPHGVDPSMYTVNVSGRQKAVTKRRRLAGDAPLVGFAGRFVRYKGLPVLVQALSRLQGVHAVVIGDGPLRPQIEEQARAAGVSERIHFLGNVDDESKIHLLSVIDVLLLPSTDTTETFGVVQVEAQLMEIPVVASRLPTGITDVTIDGETGILVPPGDPEALARAIQRLLTDRDLTARLGRAGRAHALKHFTFDIFRQRFERVFQALLAGRRIEGPLKSVSSNADVPARPWAQGDHTQPGIVP